MDSDLAFLTSYRLMYVRHVHVLCEVRVTSCLSGVEGVEREDSSWAPGHQRTHANGCSGFTLAAACHMYAFLTKSSPAVGKGQNLGLNFNILYFV